MFSRPAPAKRSFRLISAGVVLVGTMLGTAALQAAPGGDAAKGEQLFRQRCAACHSASAAKPSPLGPNLAGVVGRKAGSTAYAYSPALKASGLTWTRANIDRFLTGPAKLVPGTKMVIMVPAPADRAALTAYLATAR